MSTAAAIFGDDDVGLAPPEYCFNRSAETADDKGGTNEWNSCLWDRQSVICYAYI